ncbi:MAG TPA: hypothetical protein VFX96_19820 [Pyrinomonadaceae bacterium]|nr:hypothetical protein [Pyrinomonadaceae bacterium]
MSDKERRKKDGRNKDKKTKAAREAENPRKQGAAAPQQARDASNLTDRHAGAATSNRRRK